eukprot:1984577-Alexandrium_andersonii.AAC.1
MCIRDSVRAERQVLRPVARHERPLPEVGRFARRGGRGPRACEIPPRRDRAAPLRRQRTGPLG